MLVLILNDKKDYQPSIHHQLQIQSDLQNFDPIRTVPFQQFVFQDNQFFCLFE